MLNLLIFNSSFRYNIVEVRAVTTLTLSVYPTSYNKRDTLDLLSFCLVLDSRVAGAMILLYYSVFVWFVFHVSHTTGIQFC
jgi:hypothetical protein